MRITVSGTPGSGKTSASKMLARELNLRYYGLGEMIRKTAVKKGVSLIKFTEYLETHKLYNKKFNDSIKKLNSEDNFVLDSRIGVLLIKDSVNIFLDSDPGIRAERIFRDKRKLESFETIGDVKKEILKRLEIEKKMIYELYKFDFTDPKHYDIAIDTTGMNVRKIYNIAKRYLRKGGFL